MVLYKNKEKRQDKVFNDSFYISEWIINNQYYKKSLGGIKLLRITERESNYIEVFYAIKLRGEVERFPWMNRGSAIISREGGRD